MSISNLNLHLYKMHTFILKLWLKYNMNRVLIVIRNQKRLLKARIELFFCKKGIIKICSDISSDTIVQLKCT